MWFLPAAFVSLSTTELDELGAWRRLKIFSAGVWHNLVLAAVAYVGLVYIIPILFAPLIVNFLAFFYFNDLNLNQRSTLNSQIYKQMN